MADRSAYMRDYMRERRRKARAEANEKSVNFANGTLTEERLRAIIREEFDRALEPVRKLLTKLTVSSVSQPKADDAELTKTNVNQVNSPEPQDSELTTANVNSVNTAPAGRKRKGRREKSAPHSEVNVNSS